MRTNEKSQAGHTYCRWIGNVCAGLMLPFIAGEAIVNAEPYDLQFCSFLGGNKWERVQAVFIDAEGFIYAVGWTRSSNFPTTSGAYDRTHNGDMDVFVTKLQPDGSSLVYSTFFGGSRVDQCRGGMDFDEQGNIYLSGYTDSLNFPTTGGAIQQTFKGGYGDAFVL
ncbi:MAG: SBBP repeat-containing protein [Phycisphaerales bacterium]|nr:MAG: SBBP repeat-containing protein [Phycisphaerales bacterium]UCF14421.1 MAG: SBBP repeat-containing protein [Phycisphaerales bacterium]